jgi:hypothetical protein
MPPATTDRNTMNLSEALSAAQRLGLGRGKDATVILAQFTVPGTIPPPDSPVPFRTIADRLAWVITFTSPRDENVSTVGRLMVRHFNVALDADTGEFLLGFYT